MAPSGAEVVDLTLSDDEVQEKPNPRSKRSRMEDSDVIVVESDVGEGSKLEGEDEEMGDDEIKIVSAHVEVSPLASATPNIAYNAADAGTFD